MQRRPEPPDSGSQQHDISTERTVRMSPGSFPMPAVAQAQAQAPPVPGAPTLAAAGVPIAPPTMQPGGGLTTYIGEPALATQVASAARAAQDRAQADVSTFARSVAEIAATLHDHAARLERFVEGSFSTAQADFGLSAGVVDRVWQAQQPLLTVDAQEDERLRSRVSIVAYGIRSVMCAPLRVRGHGVGIVYVDSRNQAALFDTAHLDLLAAFCNQAAIAIDNARLFADLRRRIREISAMKAYTDNIFASIASGVVTANTLGSVTAFNRAAERIFGLPGDLAVGQPYQEVLAGLGDTELSEIMRRAVTEQEVRLGHEMTRVRAAGGEGTLRA